jgi:hypothetical protein
VALLVFLSTTGESGKDCISLRVWFLRCMWSVLVGVRVCLCVCLCVCVCVYVNRWATLG